MDLYVVALVLENVEVVLIVEQVQAPSGVDLEETDIHLAATLQHLVQFLHQVLLHLVHRVGLAGAGLAVGEAGDHSIAGQQVQQWLQGYLVDVCGFLALVEGVVEGKGVILDVLGDSVDFELGLVDSDLRVGAGDGVYFSALFLLLEDGSLADADGELDMSWVTLFSEEKT